MTRPVTTATHPQLALQSYLDGLLQEAADELQESTEQQALELQAFEAAVREERLRDSAPLAPQPVAALVTAVAEAPASVAVAPAAPGARPEWAEAPFECLLFDVAGLTLAVPLVCLGTIHPLDEQELTPLFGQPDWFLGLLPAAGGNLKVLDTARWLLAERYREEFRQGLQYVISVDGYDWGLAVHRVNHSIRLEPQQVKWRSERSRRPWLAGTVIEHMCALLDVTALAGLIASGATKRPQAGLR